MILHCIQVECGPFCFAHTRRIKRKKKKKTKTEEQNPLHTLLGAAVYARGSRKAELATRPQWWLVPRRHFTMQYSTANRGGRGLHVSAELALSVCWKRIEPRHVLNMLARQCEVSFGSERLRGQKKIYDTTVWHKYQSQLVTYKSGEEPSEASGVFVFFVFFLLKMELWVALAWR